jgi:hypothetical protein
LARASLNKLLWIGCGERANQLRRTQLIFFARRHESCNA